MGKRERERVTRNKSRAAAMCAPILESGLTRRYEWRSISACGEETQNVLVGYVRLYTRGVSGGGAGGKESPPTREGRRPPHPRPSSAPRLFELLWHVRPLLSQLLVRLEEHPVRIAVVALLLLSRRHNRRRLGRLLEPSVWGLGWRVGVGVGQGGRGWG